MRNALTALTCGAVALEPRSAPAQQAIPIRNLPPASARTTQTLGSVLGMHEVAGGNVLVDDAARRQVKLFDSTLGTATVVIDSVAGGSRSYGRFPVKLIPYLGDSSLIADIASQSMLVLDSRGQVARALALPNPIDIRSVNSASSGIDNRGRLLYTGSVFPRIPAPGIVTPDSAPVLRADLESRRVDTVGRVNATTVRMSFDQADDGRTRAKLTTNPLPVVDAWSVLSNGSIAFVRGHDYHIDWIHPDGAVISTAKLPFDWKRVTDEDKQRIVDSARAAQVAAAASIAALHANDGSAGRERGRGAGGGDPGAPGALAPSFVPLKEMADFYPALRASSTIPDLDGNLWILPATSAQSQHGELVYDVVNVKGELFERVRLPVGRSIVGFGKGGVVYLQSGDKTTGFYLERTRLDAAAKVAPR
jgi:hypothetical protein